MINLLRFFFFICISQVCFSQNSDRLFVSAAPSPEGYKIVVKDGYYLFKMYNESTVETTFVPKGEEFKPKSEAVVLNDLDKFSDISETLDAIILSSEGLSVYVKKAPFQIQYTYKGKPIVSEKMGYSKNEDNEVIQFNLDDTEVLYGGGSRALGMNRRGNRLQLYNRAHYGYETRSELMNYTLPIVMSSKKYLIHFDNAPIGYLDLDSKKDNTLIYETISGRKTYQVIAADSWVKIVDYYTDLTGKQPMPPRWALGNFSSRFGYHSEAETRATVSKFKEDEIPVDAVILDLYWFGKEVQGTMGNLTFDTDSFPTPIEMIKDFKAEGVNTILITEPFVLTTSSRWQEAVDNNVLAKDSLGNPFTYDFYFGNTGLIDIYSTTGFDWFSNIYVDLFKMGVTGIWGDLGEPEVHPKALIHATGTADEVHNIYGHDWARLVYESSLKVNANRRPFILMRAGYSGSQRFGLIPWSGDVNRTWGGLQSQPEIALQMGMQGLGYMHSDLGGFAGANLDDELYVRWLQYGVFQPIYRPHAQEEVPSEPVFRNEKAKNLARKAIRLRYALLPYNYNLAFQNNQEGTPLMRPLFFENPDDVTLQNLANTYYWGEEFLVSPILEAGVTTHDVVFPKNHIWFDFYSDEKIKGGQTKTVSVAQNTIPTYVKAGAFIPMAKPMQNTKSYTGNDLVLHYYNDASVTSSGYKLYNDDGQTVNAFEKGKFELLTFSFLNDKKGIQFAFTAEIGSSYSAQSKPINLTVHNMASEPKSIKIGRKDVSFTYDKQKHILEIPVIWETSSDLEIKIIL
ncbi:TIM-barrel domain-containing protein [Formosa sp. PL04]|uniref:glycoside hydrolase family 31 protein n=1 Tax=Formosa sp. PL04 TaxID=3081755 RepID=UPI002981C444|nr:TIM-barrel domain-containing protein [Formosa sp. PL04]MDW5287993.1 glycoside hydrolase family 31 protein [Formosa sp. PL04]